MWPSPGLSSVPQAAHERGTSVVWDGIARAASAKPRRNKLAAPSGVSRHVVVTAVNPEWGWTPISSVVSVVDGMRATPIYSPLCDLCHGLDDCFL